MFVTKSEFEIPKLRPAGILLGLYTHCAACTVLHALPYIKESGVVQNLKDIIDDKFQIFITLFVILSVVENKLWTKFCLSGMS